MIDAELARLRGRSGASRPASGRGRDNIGQRSFLGAGWLSYSCSVFERSRPKKVYLRRIRVSRGHHGSRTLAERKDLAPRSLLRRHQEPDRTRVGRDDKALHEFIQNELDRVRNFVQIDPFDPLMQAML